MKLFFFKFVFFLIVMTQLWGNVVVHSLWIFDEHMDSIELVNQEEKESEQKEEKKEKDNEDKIELTFFIDQLEDLLVHYGDTYFLKLSTLHIGEIHSPPPQL